VDVRTASLEGMWAHLLLGSTGGALLPKPEIGAPGAIALVRRRGKEYNVIVQALDDGQVEVAAMDPVTAMQVVENPQLENVASQVRTRLQSMLDSL
jgi:hypothetical protein